MKNKKGKKTIKRVTPLKPERFVKGIPTPPDPRNTPLTDDDGWVYNPGIQVREPKPENNVPKPEKNNVPQKSAGNWFQRLFN
jgi:hypothetical protein